MVAALKCAIGEPSVEKEEIMDLNINKGYVCIPLELYKQEIEENKLHEEECKNLKIQLHNIEMALVNKIYKLARHDIMFNNDENLREIINTYGIYDDDCIRNFIRILKIRYQTENGKDGNQDKI